MCSDLFCVSNRVCLCVCVCAFIFPWFKTQSVSLKPVLGSGLMLFCQTILLMNASASHRLAKYAQ